MNYQAELVFFQTLLKNFHLPYHIISEPYLFNGEPDFGLRHLFSPGFDFSKQLQKLSNQCESNKIYRIFDKLLCNYLFFKLPDTPKTTFFFIGPYLLKPVNASKLFEQINPMFPSPELFSQVDQIYSNLPLLTDENTLLTMVFTLGTTIWGGMDNFSLQAMEDSVFDVFEQTSVSLGSAEPMEPLISMEIQEKRYATENEFLQAVSHGLTHKAELYINQFSLGAVDQRVNDPIRSVKNYTIVLNTLLRKAVETADVPPLHINSLSSCFAKEIELISSVKGGYQLQKDMVRKYCLLVQNHTMKGYSPLIRKVLIRIDTDLAVDLSLKTHAKLLNVNASYLSTLFKKETGSSLTDYVNHKRIAQAIFLLNSTNMQIQTIAQFCGIPDVNYFTKVFKKQIGKTPKEYRDSISTI